MMLHIDDLAKIISIENGKPLTDAKGSLSAFLKADPPSPLCNLVFEAILNLI
jgi:hypothetical protein